MTTAIDVHTGGKFRNKKVSRKTTPYDRPSTAITNPNPNNTAKSVFFSMTRTIDVYTGGKFRNKKVSRKTTPYDRPSTAITSPNPNNTAKSVLFSRLLYAGANRVLGAFWKQDQALTQSPVIGTNEEQRNELQKEGPSAFQEDVASPAQLPKAYMCTRPSKVSPSKLMLGSQAPRQDSVLLNNTTILPRTPITSLAPRTAGSLKGSENGMETPRSRGRSAMYRMARSPYIRGPSTLGKRPTASLISSHPAWELEESNGNKMAGKRRSAVLDDLGSGGSMRRIWQKANLYSQGSSLSKHKSEFDSRGQKLLIISEPEEKASEAIVENGDTNKLNSGYAFVPTESTQAASRIFEHLERMSPKEKPSSSRFAGTTEKSATKLTSNLDPGSLEKVEPSKFLLSSQNNQKSEGQPCIEENGSKRFAVPVNVLSSMNGNSTAPVLGNSPTTKVDSTLALPAEPPQKKRAFQISVDDDSQYDDNHSNAPTTNADSTLALPAEPPQKKCAFRISVDDDSQYDDNHSNAPTTNADSTMALPAEPPRKKCAFQISVDDDSQYDDNHSNGHISISLGENAEPRTAPTEVSQTPATTSKIISPSKTVSGSLGGSLVDKKKVGNNLQTSPAASSSYTQSTGSSESLADTAFSPKRPTILPTYETSTKSAEKVSPFSFVAKGISNVKPPTAASTVLPSPAHVFNFVSAAASSTPAIVSPFGMFSFNAASATNQFSQAPFGTPAAPLNNNDQTSMEDSMQEDSPSPAIPAFAPASAGTPTFAFNSGTPTPSPSTSPFQFGVQNNQPSSQNPFQVQTNQPPSQNPFQLQTNQPPSQNPFQVQTNQPPSQDPFQASGSLESHYINDQICPSDSESNNQLG